MRELTKLSTVMEVTVLNEKWNRTISDQTPLLHFVCSTVSL